MHLKGFSDAEVAGYKKQVHSNVLTNIRTLIKGAEQLGIHLESAVHFHRLGEQFSLRFVRILRGRLWIPITWLMAF